MASHNVHADPKGVFFKLGMLVESQVLLTGPSNAALADPGHGAALSLSCVTVALAGLQQPPTLDNNVAPVMMLQRVDEIGEAFGEAHERLETHDAALRPSILMRVFESLMRVFESTVCAAVQSPLSA